MKLEKLLLIKIKVFPAFLFRRNFYDCFIYRYSDCHSVHGNHVIYRLVFPKYDIQQ